MINKTRMELGENNWREKGKQLWSVPWIYLLIAMASHGSWERRAMTSKRGRDAILECGAEIREEEEEPWEVAIGFVES